MTMSLLFLSRLSVQKRSEYMGSTNPTISREIAKKWGRSWSEQENRAGIKGSSERPLLLSRKFRSAEISSIFLSRHFFKFLVPSVDEFNSASDFRDQFVIFFFRDFRKNTSKWQKIRPTVSRWGKKSHEPNEFSIFFFSLIIRKV